jgi:hypothetical protein
MFWSSGGKQAESGNASFLSNGSAVPQVPEPSQNQELQYGDKPFLPTPDNSFVLFPAPPLDKFLLDCDSKYGRKPGEYSQFLERLVDEAIRVQHFKKLTAEEFANLGITKIGWILNLREAAALYE